MFHITNSYQGWCISSFVYEKWAMQGSLSLIFLPVMESCCKNDWKQQSTFGKLSISKIQLLNYLEFVRKMQSKIGNI